MDQEASRGHAKNLLPLFEPFATSMTAPLLHHPTNLSWKFGIFLAICRVVTMQTNRPHIYLRPRLIPLPVFLVSEE